MIPLRDVVPSRTLPIVTVSIIAANALVWAIELSLPALARQAFVRDYGVVPAFISWTSLATSLFVHGGWVHVTGNMWYLWIFGGNVEDRLGHGRFLAFYLLCGVAGALAHAASVPGSGIPLVGASAAVAGVMGAYFVLFPQSRVLALVPLVVFVELVEIPAIFFLGLWFVLQLFTDVGAIARTAATGGGIAIWAHLAGFAAGALAVFAFRRRERLRVEWWGD